MHVGRTGNIAVSFADALGLPKPAEEQKQIAWADALRLEVRFCRAALPE